MIITVDIQFNIGDLVYLVTDPYQYPRIITGIFLRKTLVSYELSLGENLSAHFDFELSKKPTLENKREYES